MKIVKVKYIPVGDIVEKTIELYDVHRITENLIGEYLIIEIDDTNHTNNLDILSDMKKGTIVSVILEDLNGNVVYEVFDYLKLKSFSRTIYNVVNEEDHNPNNDNSIRLTFIKRIEE